MVARPHGILIVDDEPLVRRALIRLFKGDYEVEACETGREALERLREGGSDAVLVDVRLPDMDGLDLLRMLRARWPETEVIIITGYGSVPQAVEALKAGAYDYVTKPFDPDEMRIRVRNAIERRQLRQETRLLKEQVAREYGFPNIVGQSKPMRDAYALARKAAESDTTVLLTGESGTGKELFARAIHYASERRSRPFVAINCGAMPRELIESELFGHVKGAFTGATRDKKGLFGEADGGSLFLDEVTELHPDLQVKLNRVIEEKRVRRVGDVVDMPVDVRIIAATNRDLTAAMARGEFRQDLYYRLDVFPIHLPPLRERVGDVPLLVRHFIQQIAGENADSYRVEPEAMALLMDYDWPGNVRQLRNAIERAIVLCEGGRIAADLFPFIKGRDATATGLPVVTDLPYREAMEQMRRACRRRYLLCVLRASNGNVAEAARRAGIRRESFYRLMRECGLRPGRV